MNVLGRFANMLCGAFGVTPAHLDELRGTQNGTRARSPLRAYEWENGDGAGVNVLQVRMRYGWPVG